MEILYSLIGGATTLLQIGVVAALVAAAVRLSGRSRIGAGLAAAGLGVFLFVSLLGFVVSSGGLVGIAAGLFMVVGTVVTAVGLSLVSSTTLVAAGALGDIGVALSLSATGLSLAGWVAVAAGAGLLVRSGGGSTTPAAATPPQQNIAVPSFGAS